MGADKGVLVSDDSLQGADALATARVLAAAIKRTEFDLVIAGVESTDGYTGTMPSTLAELLGVPQLTFAKPSRRPGTSSRSTGRRLTATTSSSARCPL